MTKPYIQQRLKRLEENRQIGKPGLSIHEVRIAQVKVRFTDFESDFLSLMADKLCVPKAVLSNVLILDAVIDMLASDDQFRTDVMQSWSALEHPSLDFFHEIASRARGTRQAIEGTRRPVTYPGKAAHHALHLGRED